jgi:DNA-directed RNA polymerase subunit H (RpoH/RPB5)
MNTSYIIYNIYDNVHKYLGVINYEPVDTKDNAHMEKKEFMKNMQFHGYVKIKATNADGKVLYAFILRKGSDTGRKTAKFMNILNSIKEKEATLVVFSDIGIGEHIKKFMKTKYTKKKIVLKDYLFKHFKTSPRDNVLVPKHRLCSDEEAEVIKKDNMIKSNSQFPRISPSDAQVIWLGAVPGQVIEITRHTDVGVEMYYRVVK